MSRKGAETVYLHQKDGKKITGESLEEILESHPEIKTVVLFYVWNQDYYTSNAFIFEAYVSERTIDQEYCFFGDREDALEFSRSYECWDGEDFLLFNGNILYGYQENTDYQTSWNDGYDHSGGLSENYDPSWFSFLRVDFDYKNGIEYLLSPDPIDWKDIKEVSE